MRRGSSCNVTRSACRNGDARSSQSNRDTASPSVSPGSWPGPSGQAWTRSGGATILGYVSSGRARNRTSSNVSAQQVLQGGAAHEADATIRGLSVLDDQDRGQP